jgi:hypothetical protein
MAIQSLQSDMVEGMIPVKTLHEYVNEKFNTRSNVDRRRRVNRLIVSYKDNAGDEYRKAYEFPVNMKYDEMTAQIPVTID